MVFRLILTIDELTDSGLIKELREVGLKEFKKYCFVKHVLRKYPLNRDRDLIDNKGRALARIRVIKSRIEDNKTIGEFMVYEIYKKGRRNNYNYL